MLRRQAGSDLVYQRPLSAAPDTEVSTFEGITLIVVAFAEMLSVEHAAMLQDMGYVATSSGLSWHLIGDRSLGHLVEAMERMGLTPREMHFQRPSLDSLFLRLLLQHPMTAPEGTA